MASPFLLRGKKALPFPPGGHPRTGSLTPCSEGAGRLPAGLQVQWRDQMRDKFGLDFRMSIPTS